MLGFDPLASTPIAALGEDDALVGQYATTQQGTLGVTIEVALTGQSCTASQGTMGIEVPLLLSQIATVSSGTCVPHISVALTGQACTASGGTLKPALAVMLVGQQAIAQSGQFLPRLAGAALAASAGTITPTVSVALVGHALSVSSTSPTFINATGVNANVQLMGRTAAVGQGVVTPALSAGTAALTFTAVPAVATAVSSLQAFSRIAEHIRVQAVWFEGKYVLVGEGHDGSGSDWATVISSDLLSVDPDTRVVSSFGTPNWDSLRSLDSLNPKLNGNSSQTFDSGKEYSAAPRKWGLGYTVGTGVEGNIVLTRIRTEDRFLTYPLRTRHIAHEEMHSTSFVAYLGAEVTHDIDNSLYQSGAGAEDGPVNSAIGVVPLRPTYPAGGSDSSWFKLTHALVFFPSLWNDGADNWVPTFVKVTKDINPVNNTETFSNEFQLRTFAGVSNLWAMQDSLVITHSGYGHVAYLTYLASTSGAPRTPSYVGLIVMDLDSFEVFAHTVKPLAAAATTFTPIPSQYAPHPNPHRTVSEPIRLSDGRSVTQFMLRDYIVHLAWTAGTHRNPVMTPKDGPVTSGGSNFLAAGVDFLEAKGDTVYHVLVQVNSGGWTGSSRTFAFRPFFNDATTSGATWTLPGSDLWSWNLNWGFSVTHYPQFYSGYHQGKQSWFAQTEYSFSSLVPDALRAGEAWIDFWSDQPDILTVTAEGRVGQVTPNVFNMGVAVQLVGQSCTATASNGLISGASKTVALTGLSCNVNYTPLGATADVVVPLSGAAMEVTTGALGHTGKSVSVALYGQYMTMQMMTPTALPPGTVQLSGFSLSSARGTLTPHITVALTGQSCSVSGGTLTPFIPLFAGLQVTASAGALVPVVAGVPAGQAVTTSGGSLAPALAVVPGVPAATISRGVVVPTISVQLVGQACTAAQGAMVRDVGPTLIGQAVTGSVGSLGPAGEVRLTGTVVVMSSGTVVPLTTIPLLGAAVATQCGSFAVFMGVVLSGRVATVNYGSLGIIADAFVTLTGVQALGVVGPVITNAPPRKRDANLWTQADDNDLFVVTLP